MKKFTHRLGATAALSVLLIGGGLAQAATTLAPGKYALSAVLAGKTLHRSVVVKSGQPAKAVFVWPTGTGETLS